MQTKLPRRRMLSIGLGAGIGLAATGPMSTPAAANSATTDEQPVSMAMHIHSCFSEGGSHAKGGGGGSMMAHLDQATQNDVDVIWWTDHDWRMEAYGYLTGIKFDGTPEGYNMQWVEQEAGNVQSSHAFVSSPHSPQEAGKALQVTATANGTAWSRSVLWAHAGNSFYATNLTDTTLTIDVLSQQTSSDAELVIEVGTAYRPSTAGRPAGEYVLQYRLGTSSGRSLDEPLVGVVRTVATGSWQTLTLNLLDDIQHFWPDLVAQDSSMARLAFGITTRNGATGQGVFDHLQIQRAARQTQTQACTWPLQTQGAIMTDLAPAYPQVTQFQSAEISMVRHLNVFMDNFQLYPYPPTTGAPSKDNSVSAAENMVQWYHNLADGVLVQYNHPPTDFDELVDTNALGTDLIEVANAASSQDVLLKRIQLFDVACRNAIFLTATSGADDHVGRNWLAYKRRYVTSVWALSKQLTDLTAALASGQTWWHHLKYWPSGILDISLNGKRAMGKGHHTNSATKDLKITAQGLSQNATVDIIVGDCDRAGRTPAIQTTTYTASDFSSGSIMFTLQRQTGRYLRVEVHDPDYAGSLVGFSNPFWLLPRNNGVIIPAPRKLWPGD